MADKTLDTKGLACPLPILKTKKVLSELPKGATLEVLATDPGSVPDFKAFCESTGNKPGRAQRAGRRLSLRHSALGLSASQLPSGERLMANMHYRVLGTSGIKVSQLCLGTMMFGGPTDEADARRIIDHAPESGVNFIDTADVYTQGQSETVIGPAIKAKRDRWVLATKVAQSTGPDVTDAGLSRRHIMRAVEASLKRLQTDHIDLYYIHRVDPNTAWEQTIASLRRPDPPGQDPRVGALQRARLAHPPRRPPVPPARRAAAGRAAALLQPHEPPARGGAAAGGQGLRPGRRALQPDRARRAHRQVQGQPEGRPRRAAPAARTGACWNRSGGPRA